MTPPPRQDAPLPGAHAFHGATYREGGKSLTGAYCPRCRAFYPVGAFFRIPACEPRL